MEVITMYAVLENEKVAGVFMEEAQAGAALPGRVVPILVRKPEGAQEPFETVVMARGVRRTISMRDGIPDVYVSDLAPSWGVDAASAMEGLCDVPGAHAGVEVTRCETYPVGRLQRERLSPAAGESLELLTEKLVEIGGRRVKGPGQFCGTYLRRITDKVETQLRRSFTQTELQILAVLLKLREDDDIQLLIDLGAISEAECIALRERLKTMVPVMRHTMARFAPDAPE